MNWWDADMYTYDTAHQWFLPSREQLKDIWKIIDTDEFEWAWTGEVYVTNDGDCSYRAWKVSSNGDEATEKKMDDFFIFCLR